MTYETVRRGNGVPWEWATTQGEAKLWRQFSIDDLRAMVAKRYKIATSALMMESREGLIAIIEKHSANMLQQDRK